MARPGPPPKPSRLKAAAGNPGRRPLNDREPSPKIEVPKMPTWLSAKAKAEWRRIAPELRRLGLVAKIDMAALATYCQAVAEVQIATETIDREGRVCTWPILDKDGNKIGERLKAHPAVQQQRDAMQRVKQFAAEFGLSPSGRTRVVSGDDPDPPGGDERDQRFFGTVG